MYPNTTFFLGAGASAHTNSPLTNNFLTKALGMINELDATDKNLARAFHRVFQYQATNDRIEHLLGVDFTNIEDLFSMLDLEVTVLPSQRSLRDDLITLILHTIERSRVPETARAFLLPTSAKKTPSVNLTPLEALANLAACRYDHRPTNLRPPNAIITLNYDTILEEALQRTGVLTPDYGINELNPPPAKDQRARLGIYKLHGSSNWRVCKSCDRISSANSNTERPVCTCTSTTEVLIVPPSWNKGAHSNRLQCVWEIAFSELRNSQQWVFIGTSLPTTDTYLRYLLGVALKYNENLRHVIIVDPGDATNIKSLFERKAHRIKVTPIKQTLLEALGDGRTSQLAHELGCIITDPHQPLQW